MSFLSPVRLPSSQTVRWPKPSGSDRSDNQLQENRAGQSRKPLTARGFLNPRLTVARPVSTEAQRRKQFHEIAFDAVCLADVFEFTRELDAFVQFRSQLPDGLDDIERRVVPRVAGSVLGRDRQQTVIERDSVVRVRLRAHGGHRRPQAC
jgi:hypothetical protein